MSPRKRPLVSNFRPRLPRRIWSSRDCLVETEWSNISDFLHCEYSIDDDDSVSAVRASSPPLRSGKRWLSIQLVLHDCIGRRGSGVFHANSISLLSLSCFDFMRAVEYEELLNHSHALLLSMELASTNLPVHCSEGEGYSPIFCFPRNPVRDCDFVAANDPVSSVCCCLLQRA